MLSDVTCESNYCYFDTDHFTSFEFNTFSCENVTDVSVAECEALVDLYTSTDGDHWTNKNNWLGNRNYDATPQTVCDRYGVNCDGYIYELDLHGNNLSGTISADFN